MFLSEVSSVLSKLILTNKDGHFECFSLKNLNIHACLEARVRGNLIGLLHFVRNDPSLYCHNCHLCILVIKPFSVASAAPSAAGERKKPLSLTEPAGIAEKTRAKKIW
jgi:hypothetical protein